MNQLMRSLEQLPNTFLVVLFFSIMTLLFVSSCRQDEEPFPVEEPRILEEEADVEDEQIGQLKSREWIGDTYWGRYEYIEEGEEPIWGDYNEILGYSPYTIQYSTDTTVTSEWTYRSRLPKRGLKTVFEISGGLNMYMDTILIRRGGIQDNCLFQVLPEGYDWIFEDACILANGDSLFLQSHADLYDPHDKKLDIIITFEGVRQR